MSNYRDERDALRARSEGLEQELEAKRAEVEQLRGTAPAEERLEQLARDLTAAQAEISRMKAQLHPTAARSSGRATFIAAGIMGSVVVVTVVGGATLAITARMRGGAQIEAPAPPRPPDPPPVALPAPSPPPAPAPAAPAQSAVAQVPTRSMSTRWKGKVKSATGVALAPGTACEIAADLSADAKTHLDKLTVTCGTQLLYSTEDHAEGWSNTSFHVQEEVVPDGFARTLHYEDTGDHHPRSDVAIDTSTGVTRVWSGGSKPMEVKLTVDELDAPQKGAFYPNSPDSKSCKRFATTAKAVAVEGDIAVKRGAACTVKTRPFSGNQCQVNITCGATVLYPDKFGHVVDGAIVDDEFTPQDHDPKFRIAGKNAEVSDQAVTSWSVKLELAEAAP